MLPQDKQSKDTILTLNLQQNKTKQSTNTLQKSSTNIEKIKRLNKSLRVTAINNEVQELTSEIEESSISQLAISIDEKHQNKCEQIIEKSILELEDRILKKIEILKDKSLLESKRCQLTQTMLQEHILYVKLRRQRNKKINRKLKLQQTTESKDSNWISKLVRKLGGLSKQNKFNKLGINIQSIDSSEKQSQTQTKIYNKKSQHFVQHINKQLLSSQLSLENKYKTSTFLNKQQNQQIIDNQQYQRLQNELKQLTSELQEQTILLESIMKQNNNTLKSSRQTNKSNNNKHDLKYNLNSSKASTTILSESHNNYPFLIQRVINTKTYTALVPGQYVTIPNQVNIDIRIIPY